jgi:hypothetical protein
MLWVTRFEDLPGDVEEAEIELADEAGQQLFLSNSNTLEAAGR